MSDKIQEIRNALQAVGHLGLDISRRRMQDWLSSLLSELDDQTARANIAHSNAEAKSQRITEMHREIESLQQQLDAAKQDNERLRDEWRRLLDNRNEALRDYESLQQLLKQIESEYADERAAHNLHVTELIDMEQRLRQAIEVLEWYANGKISVSGGKYYIGGKLIEHIWQKARDTLSILREEAGNPPYMAHGSLGALFKKESISPSSDKEG